MVDAPLPADPGLGRRMRARRLARTASFDRAASLEKFLWRYRETIGDHSRSVGNLEQTLAQRTVEFAGTSGAGYELDAAETGVAFATDDVASFYGLMMPGEHNHSATSANFSSRRAALMALCRGRNDDRDGRQRSAGGSFSDLGIFE